MPYNWDKPIEIHDNRRPRWFWVEHSVWEDNRLTASDKVLYGTLAFFANGRSQELYPGIRTLAEKSCLSKAQLIISLRKLESLNYISIIRNKGKNNFYRMLRIPLVQNLDQSRIRNGVVQNKEHLLVQNKEQNYKNTKQELNNNKRTVALSPLEEQKIATISIWAFERAMGTPGCSREQFEDAVRRAITRSGYDAVYKQFAEEDNAITFLTNIKNLSPLVFCHPLG